MELEIKTKIDWIDEGCPDDYVKEEIVKHIVDSLSKTVMNSIITKAQQQIDDKLNALIVETYNNLLNRGISVYNQWGESVGKDVKIEDLIKEKLDKALGERVDENGHPNFHGDYTRLDWLVRKYVKRAVDEVNYQIEKKIQREFTQALKSKLAALLIEKIDVDTVVSDVLKKS